MILLSFFFLLLRLRRFFFAPSDEDEEGLVDLDVDPEPELGSGAGFCIAILGRCLLDTADLAATCPSCSVGSSCTGDGDKCITVSSSGGFRAGRLLELLGAD